MIKLYQFAPSWGLPNASSFCLKLETYLRMAELPFKIAPDADLRKAPKGKMPYIEDQGKTIADSNFIIEYLKATYGDRLDAHLSPAESAIALAMRRLMEENLYWVIVYSRWQEPDNWEKMKGWLFADVPPLLRGIIPPMVRKQVLKSLYGHGMGRHDREEIYQIGSTDLTALSNFLGEKPFFLGTQPTTLDATAYGFLATILDIPIESPLKLSAQQLTNLSAYCDRIREKYYQ
jgi:glutathione S-transferase